VSVDAAKHRMDRSGVAHFSLKALLRAIRRQLPSPQHAEVPRTMLRGEAREPTRSHQPAPWLATTVWSGW